MVATPPTPEENPDRMILNILMPFYGRIDHFRAAVQSVLAQTSADWTLTIVDDVYPDLSAGAWASALPDPRVRYVRNEQNLRPSRNYNRSILLATSDFVVLMGCDDIMDPDFVERVLELLAAHPDVDIVQPGVRVIDENGAASRPLADGVKALYRPKGGGTRLLSGELLARSLLRGNWTYFPSIVWRRSALGPEGFRLDLDVVQDLAKLMEITFASGILLLDDQVVFAYRRHSTSVSAVTGLDGSKFYQERILFAEAAARSSQLGWRRAARAASWHLSSRLNALSELPGALLARNVVGCRALWRHILGGLDAPQKAGLSRL